MCRHHEGLDARLVTLLRYERFGRAEALTIPATNLLALSAGLPRFAIDTAVPL